MAPRLASNLSPLPASPIPDSAGSNFYTADPMHRALARLYLGDDLFTHLSPALERLGGLAGGRLDALAHRADRNPPVLVVRNRRGEDLQHIEKHPAYEEMERLAFGDYALAALSHRPALGWPKPLPPTAKYALSYLFVQAEFGLCCPVSMTDALARTLARFGSPELVARYLPGLTSTDMEAHAQGAMFMTEQGAGSDVGATSTEARPDGDAWALTGDKWFCSNADAELALVLARRVDATGEGTRALSLFLLPRTLDDGSPNRYRIVRLKDKLGTRSMASGEIRLEGARAYLVGDPGAGFKQMADMINTSRLSNGMRAAGLMRRACFEAEHVASHRVAFGQRLADMPLVQRQLAKMNLLSESARSLMFFAAQLLATADTGDESARRALRIVTPLLKFRACRDARRVTGDAMEMRGGVGYIEEFADARLVRDAHLGSIWEGTSNIVAGDVMRASLREDALPALKQWLDRWAPDATDGLFDKAAAWVEQVAHAGHTELHRQASSGLYYATAARVMQGEAQRLQANAPDLAAQRLAWAQALCRHKLMPRDPLSA